ncbi:MAG: hypothetical protein ACJA1Z_002854 [Patiriisocius sp.]|jgi:hypothetical protein
MQNYNMKKTVKLPPSALLALQTYVDSTNQITELENDFGSDYHIRFFSKPILSSGYITYIEAVQLYEHALLCSSFDRAWNQLLLQFDLGSEHHEEALVGGDGWFVTGNVKMTH